jgi:G6PDH family F420-dependent oxidoreductase
MSEEHGPSELVRNAARAEEAGFDFVAISDHFHPWLSAQGHSPAAWTVLGAIAARTQRVGLVTAVTCPTLRYHPATVAQSAATLAILSNGRFTLGSDRARTSTSTSSTAAGRTRASARTCCPRRSR